VPFRSLRTIFPRQQQKFTPQIVPWGKVINSVPVGMFNSSGGAMARPSSRTSRRGEETRESILVAARKLFTQRGYHKTSVYDLFELSGISKGAFFHHWKTKEELALEILDSVRLAFEDKFFATAHGEGRAREKIERSLRLLGDLSQESSWVYGKIFALWCAELDSDHEQLGPAVHALRMRWCVYWKEMIERAQHEHDLRADISAENLSFLVISAIFGVQLMSSNDKTESVKTALETLRRALLT
jgi:TetR/AcrR family transcriptional regulator, transcriptional repressor for nem operon